MAIPSIAMIPSGYKAGKLYSVLPTNGNADLDVVRNSTANRINKDGLIESMAVNVPLLDYSDSTCPSLLLQPQSTNLITYPLSFGNSYWYKSGASIEVQGFASPSVDYPTSAFKLVEDTSNSQHAIWSSSSVSVVANTYLTFSAYVKKVDRKYVAVSIAHNSTNGTVAQFDLDTQSLVYSGDVGTIYTYVSGGIETIGNDWYKLSIVLQTTLTSIQPAIALSDDIFTSPSILNSANYTGDGTSGVYIFGAQLEQLSYPTSLMLPAVEGSTTTRLKDEVSKSGLSADINSAEGTLFVEMSALALTATNRRISLTDVAITDFVYIYFSSTNTLSARVQAGGLQEYQYDFAVDITQLNKVALKWKVNDFAFYVNGVKVNSQLSGNVPSANDLVSLNFEAYGSSNMEGNVNDLQVFKTALSDTKLAELTS